VGIALYPEDGATKDSLLSTADAAMYASKNAKRQINQKLVPSRTPDPPPNSALEERAAVLADGP
jgi:GGDEF domain-containing protein